MKRVFFLLGCLVFCNVVRGKAPRGIYVFPTPIAVANGDYEKALAVAGVDGVAIVFNWAELSPSGPGTYDFTALDRLMALARTHHLAVELVIEAGKGIPEWIFSSSPAGLGARRLDFVYSHHKGAGPPKRLAMPPPWDPLYLNAFAELLNQVAAHLKSTGADRDLSAIKLTGLNTLSEELRLPAQTPEETGRAESTDSVAIWLQAGYRPSLLQKAFTSLVRSFASAFPDIAIVLPVILGGEFPPIDERGQVLPRGRAHKLNEDLLAALVGNAAQLLPKRFILQHDFLVADQPAASAAVALARNNSLPIAWQTNLFYGGQGQGAGAVGRFGETVACDEASYLKLLENGIHPVGGTGPNAQACFIEVFPYDAITFPLAIIAAHDKLTK
jgi:hypothetical protein